MTEAPPPGERFAGFATDGESWALQNGAPLPPRPADRTPERAPLALLVPAAGDDAPRLENWRLWVERSALMLRDEDGTVSTVATAAQVRSVCWVVDDGCRAALLPPEPGGWVVVCGPDGPLLAIAAATLGPRWLTAGASGADLRRTGVPALADALTAPLVTVAAAPSAPPELGRVTRPVLRLLRPARQPARGALSFALVLGFPIALLVLGLLGQHQVLAVLVPTVVAVVALLDLATIARRRRRVATLPGRCQAWWHPPGGRTGSGIGVQAGPLGEEVVVADGHGTEAWYAGPRLGGVTSIAVAHDEAGAAYGLLLLSRDEASLLDLRVPTWVTPDGLAGLRTFAAAHGLAVSDAELTLSATAGGTALARAVRRLGTASTDLGPVLGLGIVPVPTGAVTLTAAAAGLLLVGGAPGAAAAAFAAAGVGAMVCAAIQQLTSRVA